MTANEFRNLLNKEYGSNKPWPEQYEVDAETFANCCQAIFENVIFYYDSGPNYKSYLISLGKNSGPMFKGVELILKGKEK